VALVKANVLEEPIISIIRVKRISELGTTLAVTRILPKCRFLQEPHGIASQKAEFFIATAVKTSNLTSMSVLSPYNQTLVLQQLYAISRREELPEGHSKCFPYSIPTCY
jgi:hypothetical protein